MAIDVVLSKIVIAGLSYVQPVFKASYVEIGVTASVSMPDFLGVEVLTPTDAISLTPVKNTFDGLSTSDSFLKGTEKGLFETVTPLESIYTQLVFIRNFAELLDPLDATALNSILSKIDQITVAEQKELSFLKNVSDSTSIVDMMDGNITYTLIKVLSEFSSLNDLQIIDFAAQKADNIETISSGVLSMQDYCDITYFLEDYVGLSRTFT